MTTKTAAKRTTSKKTKAPTFYEKIEGTMIGQPIVIANKAFLASLGLVATVSRDFVKKVDELAKDGEVVRDEYQASIEKFRGEVLNQVKESRERTADRARKFTKFVTDSFPLATDDDVQELEQKIDKVLVEVAK